MQTCQWRDEGECALDQDGDDGEDNGMSDDFSSWVGQHRALFIGLCTSLGGSLILFVAFMIFASAYRKRRNSKRKRSDNDFMNDGRPHGMPKHVVL
jgi:hypothetical protein